MKNEDQQKIAQLQMLEQNLQNLIAQKQNFQAQTSEINNALEEVKKTKEGVFKIVGPTMISVDKKNIEKELTEKQEVLNLRIKNFEKQEKQFKEKFETLQKEVLKNIKK